MKTLRHHTLLKSLNVIWDCILMFDSNQEFQFPNPRFFKKIIFGFYLFLSFGISTIHASDSTKIKVWIDYIEESDTAYVKGLFSHLVDEEKNYTWEMKIYKESQIETFDSTLNGAFTAKPYSLEIISEYELNLKKRKYIVIIYNVFDKEKYLVGSDTLTSEMFNPPILKPTSSNPLIVKRDLPKPKNNLDALEIDGLILDETRSKIGRDFYELFYNRWSPPFGAKDFLITIKELPARGIGARVSIQVNENIILYRFLQPRGDLVEQEVNISISHVKNFLQKNENLKQDIESGDQVGSGIY